MLGHTLVRPVSSRVIRNISNLLLSAHWLEYKNPQLARLSSGIPLYKDANFREETDDDESEASEYLLSDPRSKLTGCP
jgi:hypothetical protein